MDGRFIDLGAARKLLPVGAFFGGQVLGAHGAIDVLACTLLAARLTRAPTRWLQAPLY